MCSQATATKTFKIEFYASITWQLFNRLNSEYVTWANKLPEVCSPTSCSQNSKIGNCRCFLE